MTKIDFYLTDSGSRSDYWQFICRLTEKAYRQRHQIYLHTDGAESTQQLDELLWSFRPNSFVPHRSQLSCDDKQHADSPIDDGDIFIGHGDDPGEHHDVLINTSDKTPPFFSRFSRLAEVVIDTVEAKEKSRQRYAFYRDRGYPLEVHSL